MGPSLPERRLAGRVVASVVIGAAALVTPGPVVHALTEEEQICGEAEAYSVKLGKAERRRLEAEAKQDAFTNLARQLWSEAFDPAFRPAGSDGEPAPPPAVIRETERRFASLRNRYEVGSRLAGGTYDLVGDKQQRKARYCIPFETYLRLREDLRRERADVIAAFRDRFRHVEALIGDGDLDRASEELVTLSVDVVTEALETTPYRSITDDRTRPFYVWLLEWGDFVPHGPESVRRMTERAAGLVDSGQLEEADRFVAEALKIDRDDRRALELRDVIQERRTRHLELLQEAEGLAAAGRFAASREALEQAEAISVDEPLLVEETTRTISGLQASYLQYNPATRVAMYAALGSLGADPGAIGDRVGSGAGATVDGETPFSFGAGANFRVGRFLVFGVTGGVGVSQDASTQVNNAPLQLFRMYQLTGGVGYRTTRSENRKIGYQVTGGLVWEYVDVNELAPSPLSGSDQQTAFFVRFWMEWNPASLFIQHGFGFRDSPDSLVGWSNNFQIGVAALF